MCGGIRNKEKKRKMKKRSAFAGAIALSLILSGCGGSKETEKKTSKKTKKTTADESIESTLEDPEETSSELDTDTTDASTDASQSDATSDNDTKASSAPAAAPKSFGDPYDFYASDRFEVPDLMLVYLSALTSWSTTITIYPESHQFEGDYSSTMGNIDGDGYDIERCEFTGMIDGFVRKNDYSFSTHVLNLDVKKFDEKQEEYDGMPAKVVCADPYGFTSPDELILYLPNTPLSEAPQELLDWIEPLSEHKREQYLGDIVLYNPAEGTAFLVVTTAIPESREVEASDLSVWNGSYIDDHNNVSITVDAATSTASIQTPGSQYSGLAIRTILEDADKPVLLIYGENDAGNYVYAKLGVAQGHDNLMLIHTDDKAFPGIGDYYLKNA